MILPAAVTLFVLLPLQSAVPKKKEAPAPKGVSPDAAIVADTDKALRENAAADRAESKALSKILGDEPVVMSSRHFSVKGGPSREAVKDALDLAEKAYADLNVLFEREPDEAVFKAGKGGRLHVFVGKDLATQRDLLPVIEAQFGALDPYLKDDVRANGGLAATSDRPVSLTRSDADLKTYLLHQLGQVYVESLIMGATPAFLSEGFAVYVSIRWGGRNSVYCFNPASYKGNVGKEQKGQDVAYLLLCQEAASEKNDPSIEALAKKKLNQLTDVDLAKAWSIARLILETKPDEGRAFIRLFDANKLPRVLKASFHQTPAEFDEAWRELHK